MNWASRLLIAAMALLVPVGVGGCLAMAPLSAVLAADGSQGAFDAREVELAQAAAPAPRKKDPPAATPAAPPAAPAAAVPAQQTSLSARLAQAGVRTCLSKIDALGAAAMGGAAISSSASNWQAAAPDAHLAGVLVGQKYPDPKVPYGFAGIFAAPDGGGGCDGVSVQVLASPASCLDLQATILQRGKLIADLAGVPYLQDVGSQVALVPTGANACVLVSIHLAYGAKP